MVKKIDKHALHVAIHNDNIESVKELLARRSSINAADDNGITPMHYAAMHGNAKIIHLLRVHGAQVNIVDFHGESPLHLAAKSHDIQAVKELFLMKPDLNVQDRYGNTPLHYAIEVNDIKMVELLLENGAMVNLINKNYETPLSIAIKNSNKPIKKLLIKFGAKKPMNFLQIALKSVQTSNYLRKIILLSLFSAIIVLVICTCSLTGIDKLAIISGLVGFLTGFILLFMDKPYRRVKSLEAKHFNNEVTNSDYEIILNRDTISQDDRRLLEQLNITQPINDNLLRENLANTHLRSNKIH
jgi:hypothetical protein